MELSRIRAKAKEFVGQSIELVAITKTGQKNFKDNKIILAKREGDVYLFAFVGLDCGTRDYYCTAPIRPQSLKKTFKTQIKTTEDEFFKDKEDPRRSYGMVRPLRYVYIAGDKEDANTLREHFNSRKLSENRHVTWLKAPTKAYSEVSLENLMAEAPKSKFILIGPHANEVSTKHPDIIRREELLDWEVNPGIDFIEIIPLGLFNDCAMYVSSYRNGVLKVPVGNSAKYILTLAPVKYWQDLDKFWIVTKRGEKVLDYGLIGEYLNELSARVGQFNLSKFKGSGYYWNPTTESLYCRSGYFFVGEPPVDSHHLYSREIYEPKAPMHGVDIEYFTRIFDSFCWDKPFYGRVLLAWVLLAPFSGALQYRPHVWVNGEKSSGKTWIFQNVVMRMLKGLSVAFTMGTTEAGLVRSLSGDALPILHDEFESNRESKKREKDGLIEYFRGCSTASNDDMNMVRCSIGGQQVQSFKASSMVMLGSIKNTLSEPQDIARFLNLSLSRYKRKSEFKATRHLCEAKGEELTQKYRDHVNKLFYDFKRLRHLIARHEANFMQDYPDTVFHALRGLAALQSILSYYSIPLSSEQIKFFVDKFDSHDIKESEKILNSIFLDERWQYGRKTSLYETLLEAIRRRRNKQSDDVYHAELKKLGIKFKITEKGDIGKIIDADVKINCDNRIFRHRFVKDNLPRNWKSILLEDTRVEMISERSIKICNFLKYLRGGSNEHENNKGQEVD